MPCVGYGEELWRGAATHRTAAQRHSWTVLLLGVLWPQAPAQPAGRQAPGHAVLSLLLVISLKLADKCLVTPQLLLRQKHPTGFPMCLAFSRTVSSCLLLPPSCLSWCGWGLAVWEC